MAEEFKHPRYCPLCGQPSYRIGIAGLQLQRDFGRRQYDIEKDEWRGGDEVPIMQYVYCQEHVAQMLSRHQ